LVISCYDSILFVNCQIDLLFFVQLKQQFGINYGLFGGVVGFQKWVDTAADPSCTVEVNLLTINEVLLTIHCTSYCITFLFWFSFMQQKAQISILMGNFASGMLGLMTTLVQGWSSLKDNAGAEMANQFGKFAHGIVSGGASPSSDRARPSVAATCDRGRSSAAAPSVGDVDVGTSSVAAGGTCSAAAAAATASVRVTRAGSRLLRGAGASIRIADASPSVLPSDNTFVEDTVDSSSSDESPSSSYLDSNEDNADQFVYAPRVVKEPRFVDHGCGDDVILSLTDTAFNEEADVGLE
jgi:hypothetical protein